MASNINPNNIDGSYPVAGQDNNSQGFRDNFTNIKVNFQYAEEEINDLDFIEILKKESHHDHEIIQDNQGILYWKPDDVYEIRRRAPSQCRASQYEESG